jgi:hypothetical protein
MFFYFLLWVPYFVCSLTKYDFTLIRRIAIDHIEYRPLINQFMFREFQPWAKSEAKQHKLFHRYKCSHISLVELQQYSCLGLVKGIQKANFTKTDTLDSLLSYLSKYIHGSLFQGMTELHPISIHSPQQRKKRTNDTLFRFPIYVGLNEWMYDKYSNDFDQQINIENFIDNPLIKRMIYFRYERNIAIKRLPELLGVSEETIRKEWNKEIHKRERRGRII